MGGAAIASPAGSDSMASSWLAKASKRVNRWWPQRDFHFVGVLGACEHGGVGAARPKAIAAAPRPAEGLTSDAAPAEEALQQEASLGPAGGEHASHVAPQGLQARREPRAIERDRARQRIEGS